MKSCKNCSNDGFREEINKKKKKKKGGWGGGGWGGGGRGQNFDYY